MLKQLTSLFVALVAFLAAPAALAAPATQLKILLGPSANIGVAFSIQVQALDSQQFVDTGFTGTVDFGSSDDFATLPIPYLFTPLDAGVKTFSIIFRTTGSHTISAFTTTGSFIKGTSSAISVAGGTAATFTISAPATANLNVPFNFTLSAKDAYGNAAAAYTGTVRFTSSDTLATLPANATLTNGAGTFSATLKTLGTQFVTATDTVNSSLTATSGVITVTSAPAQLTPSPSTLDFGGQSMKTTAPAKTLTLTNSGGVATTITSITTSTYFSVTHNCTTLNPAATCAVIVTFTPTAEGALNGTLTIVSGAGTQTVPLVGTGEKSLVTHYYLSILRRSPDAAGKSFWNAEASRMTTLGANPNETWYAMSGAFFFSTEYAAFNRTDAEYVTDLYNTFFNRAPDPTGFADWLSKLSQGMPREVVGTSFMFSAEFTAFTQGIFGTSSVRAEIDMDVDFYRGILGRLPDDAGFNSWLTRLRNAQCSGAAAVNSTVEDISSQFALSAEYAGRNRTNSQYVGDLYNAFLRRGGDLAGVQFWINEISSGRQTREAVRKQFVASPEFTGRVNAVIAAGCLTPPNTGDNDINGNPIPAPSGAPGATMCEFYGQQSPFPGAGGGPCGAYQIPIDNCSTGMSGVNAISKAWMYILEDYTPTSPRLGNSIRFGMQRDHAMVFRFKTGPASAFPEFSNNLNRYVTIGYEEQSNRGPLSPRFVTLSQSKCDFDYNKTIVNGTLNGCYKTMNGGDSLLAQISLTGVDPNVGFPYCQLKPDTTYYLNIRYEDAGNLSSRGTVACPTGANPSNSCGQAVGFN